LSLVATISKSVRNITRRICGSKHGVSRPIYAKNDDGGLKIHLGAGPINLQGWVSIDARKAPHVHLQSEGFALDEFTDGAISEIYMCHVLEHFSFEEIEVILRNLHKKLKVGGILRLSVPDFDSLVTVYHANGNNLELIKLALMGGQDYAHNFHKSVFNRATLSRLLVKHGFIHVETWGTHAEFGVHIGDWSEANFSIPKGEVPISLNLKARKA
jgi:predicted SAM-dependent methyltransferase